MGVGTFAHSMLCRKCNSAWFINKDCKGDLWFSIEKDNGSLICKIEDNGIGRARAYSTSQCYDLLAQAVGSSGSVYHGPVSGNEIADISHNQFLYPNPASQFVYLRFNSVSEGSVDVQILNTVGQLVKKYPVGITKGYNQVKIPVNDIIPGMYLMRINNSKLNLTRKFVIAR